MHNYAFKLLLMNKLDYGSILYGFVYVLFFLRGTCYDVGAMDMMKELKGLGCGLRRVGVWAGMKKKKKIIFYYIIQQYKIGPRDSTAPTESQTGSRTLHNGPQYKTGATKE